MSLTPERFAQVQALWEAAVELPAEERDALLRREAPDDADLRQEVARLLAAHDSTGRIFDQPLVRRLGLPGVTGHPSLAGRMLGAYRVVREIGEGGMGTVYEAVRADDQFTKRVAIKTLRAGADSASMLRRFQRERQIQAALAHPNIATLLDAGITDDGIPYIVLEYIDGLPIDEFCEQHRLGLPARLDLFRQVTQAVQHAHRQLVVHRDLKPNNILVTPEGTVKLLDFGISKLLSESTDQTVTEGARAFTTAYASPEQIRGTPISTATDVYSLGVVLYRILTGRVPFEVDASAPTAVWARICDEPPAPPSTVATAEAAAATDLGTPERLGRALRGELDAIVLMALRKEPDRRYATADAMGEDIHHYLRGLPVLARPDSAGYRIRRLVGRNRLAAGAVVLAFLAMAGGTAVSLWQAREARAERAVADQERRTAERVSEFLQDIFGAADASWLGRGLSPQATIAEAIDSAAARIDTELADEPRVAEVLHQLLGSSYGTMRQLPKAVAHARRFLALQQARNAPPAELARGLHDLGAQLYLSGQRDTALVVLQEAYDRLEEAGFPEGETMVVSLNDLGLVLWELGRPDEAEPHLSRALEVNQRLNENPVMSAVISNNLGTIHNNRGDLAGAEAHFRRALEILAGIPGREFLERGVLLHNAAVTLVLRDRFSEAGAMMTESLEILLRLLGPDHIQSGIALLNQARIEVGMGRPEAALATVGRANRTLASIPPTHPERARFETCEAEVLLALGRLSEGEPLARRALATRLAAYPAGNWRIAESQLVLGRILKSQGAGEEAVQLIRDSHAAFLSAFGPDDPRTRSAARELPPPAS